MDNNNNNNNKDYERSFNELFSEEEQPDDSYTYERERMSYNRSNAMRRAKSRRNRTKRTILMISVIVLLAALWLVAAFAIVRSVWGTQDPSDTGEADATGSVLGNETDQITDGEEDPTPENGGFTTVSMAANDYKFGKLILISAAYKYEQAADTTLSKELVGVYEYNNKSYFVAQSAENIMLRMDTVSAMNSMFDAFKTETGLSGYCIRDYYCYCTAKDQQKWFEATEAKHGAGAVSYEFKGGESEHEAGRTFDLKVDIDGDGIEGAMFISNAVATEPKYSWIYENCYKYGIIDRYPADKKTVTNVDMKEGQTLHCDHFRYVGVAAATAMHDNGWCLEEFLVNIQSYTYNGKHLKAEGADGTKYEMYYYPATQGAATEVKVPDGAKYEISGDNMGGYIITVTLEK